MDILVVQGFWHVFCTDGQAIKIFKATPNALRTSKEADFIAQFVSQEMARYDGGKEHKMAKLKLKIADASTSKSEAYVSMVYDYVCCPWDKYVIT